MLVVPSSKVVTSHIPVAGMPRFLLGSLPICYCPSISVALSYIYGKHRTQSDFSNKPRQSRPISTQIAT